MLICKHRWLKLKYNHTCGKNSALSMFVSVQEMKRFTESGMTYDQIGTVAFTFVLYNLCTRLPVKIASLYISLFQGIKVT